MELLVWILHLSQINQSSLKFTFYLSIYLSIYLYCVTLSAEYYAQGCLRWRKAWTYLGILGICRTVKPQPEDRSQTKNILTDFFFPYNYFVPGGTRTCTEEVCSSVVKYRTSTDWAIPASIQLMLRALLLMQGLLEGGFNCVSLRCESPSYKYYLIMI